MGQRDGSGGHLCMCVCVLNLFWDDDVGRYTTKERETRFEPSLALSSVSLISACRPRKDAVARQGASIAQSNSFLLLARSSSRLKLLLSLFPLILLLFFPLFLVFEAKQIARPGLQRKTFFSSHRLNCLGVLSRVGVSHSRENIRCASAWKEKKKKRKKKRTLTGTSFVIINSAVCKSQAKDSHDRVHVITV